MSHNKTFNETEARRIGDSIGINWDLVDINEFRAGLSVELEHGSHDAETNVIDDNEQMAGKIAWAHLKEIRDYYTRLKVMEDEGEAYWESQKTKNSDS